MTDAGSVKVWVLAFVVAFGAGTALLIGIGCAVGANACPFGKKHPITTTDGHDLFVQQCALCHGTDARGGSRGPSLVSGRAAIYTLDELRSKIGRGKPLAGMPSYRRTLTPSQIEAVARYVMSLREAS